MSTVAKMHPGEIKTIKGLVDDEISLKLLEMGCIPGSKLTFNYKAPFGDPVCVSVSGYDLSLRISEADSIIVE